MKKETTYQEKTTYRYVENPDAVFPSGSATKIYLLDKWGNRYYFFNVYDKELKEMFVKISLPKFGDYYGSSVMGIIREINDVFGDVSITIKKF